MLAAIILAAGESSRMRSPKALLTYHGKTFIRGVADLLTANKLSPIVVVVGAHSELVRHELTGLNVRITTNHAHQAGQLLSLQKGLEVVREGSSTGVLVHPVDHPAVKAETVQAICTCFAAGHAPVVTPTYNGRRGHPVIFSVTLFEELMNAPVHIGARAVVWRHAQDILDVATDDCAILQSIDTPEDYDRLLSAGR